MASPSGQGNRDRTLRVLAVALVGLGIALRLYEYWQDPSLWFDETALILNVLSKSYADLLGPLDNGQCGPPLFLWLEKALVEIGGDRPCVWRFPALMTSCLSLVLLHAFCRRVFPPSGTAWAVAFLAFSDRMLWHTVEVRPYTMDAFVTVCLLTAWSWTNRWSVAQRAALFALAAPLILPFSYPSIFVYAGLAVALLLQLVSAPEWKCRSFALGCLGYGLFLATVTLTSLWLIRGPVQAQREGLIAAGFSWEERMLPWEFGWASLMWPIHAMSGVLRYCLGPTGKPLIFLATIGAIVMIRAGHVRLVALMLSPLAASMIAAAFHRYPCGYCRMSLFIAPAAAIFVGAAIPVLFRQSLRLASDRRIWASLRIGCAGAGMGLAIYSLVPLIFSLYHVARPWPRFDCREAASYVLSHRQADERIVICFEQGVPSTDMAYFCRACDATMQCRLDDLHDASPSRYWLTFKLPWGEKPFDEFLHQGQWHIHDRRVIGQILVVLIESASPRA
jgi:hypothetical protein